MHIYLYVCTYLQIYTCMYSYTLTHTQTCTWANIGFFLYQLYQEVRKLVRRLEHLPLKI